MPSYKGVESPSKIIRNINDKKEKMDLYKQGGSVKPKPKPSKIIKNGKR